MGEKTKKNHRLCFNFFIKKFFMLMIMKFIDQQANEQAGRQEGSRR